MPLIHSYIKLREHVHKNTTGAIDKHKKKRQKFIWHNNLLFHPAFVNAKIGNLFYSFVNSYKSQESQIKAKRLKITKNISQNDIINFTLRPNQVLKGQGSSADSMRLANVERVHGYLVPNSCMQIVGCTCRTVAYVTIHANARNMASATLEHAAVDI